MPCVHDKEAYRQTQKQAAMKINPDNHILIADLAKAYADSRCGGDKEKTFDCDAIIGTYITAAEKTLHRACNVIRYSADIGGLTKAQADTLLLCIEQVERMPGMPLRKQNTT